MIADVFDSSDTNRDEVLSPEELDGLLAAGSPELPLPPPPPEELAKQAEAPDDLGANALLAMLNAMRGREDDEIQSVLMGV